MNENNNQKLLNMPQPKGQTGNPFGRPKGIPNKSTQQRKEAIAKIVDAILEDSETLIIEINAIPDINKKLDALKGLLTYIQPKPADEQANQSLNATNSTFDKITLLIQESIEREAEQKRKESDQN